jgi:two-component system, response regulator / RNA-binding antiterminator
MPIARGRSRRSFPNPALNRDALEAIRAISAAHPIVMFAGGDDPAFAEEAIAAGVSGVALHDVKPIMASAIALLRRYHQVEQKLAAAKAILEERRFIERAKAILMQGPRKTEPQTYRWLHKKAMDENRKLAQVVTEALAQSTVAAKSALHNL